MSLRETYEKKMQARLDELKAEITELNMNIAQNKVFTIQYKVSDSESDELIDSSENGEPMTYLHGAQNIIPGLEPALEGKSAGDELEVTIPPAETYGERSEDLIQQVPREAFQDMDKVGLGMEVTAKTEQGQINLVATEVSGQPVGSEVVEEPFRPSAHPSARERARRAGGRDGQR